MGGLSSGSFPIDLAVDIRDFFFRLPLYLQHINFYQGICYV